MVRPVFDFGVPAGPNARQADDLYDGFTQTALGFDQIWDAYAVDGILLPFPNIGLSPVQPGTYGYGTVTVNQYGQVIAATSKEAPVELNPVDFGAVFDGASDIGPALMAAYSALGPRGGIIQCPPGAGRIETPVIFSGKPVILRGAGMANASSQGTALTLAQPDGADGISFQNADGSVMSDFYLTGGGANTNQLSFLGGTFLATVQRVRFVNGWRSLLIRNSNSIRFNTCSWGGTFIGPEAVLLNGLSDGNRADPVEFFQCGISSNNADSDVVVVDGLGGSMKFISCYVGGASKRGIVMRNTTGQTTPSFVYFVGGGFENTLKEAIWLEEGNQFNAAGFYLSTDGDGNGMYIGPNFGDAEFAACRFRGSGRDGVRIAGKNVSFAGCHFINNARIFWDLNSIPVASTANNGSGLVRITSASPHGYATNDRIIPGSVQDLSSATTYSIVVISPTVFDVVGSTFTTPGSSGTTLRVDGAISGAANNGSGLIRLTFATPHNYITDDIARVATVGGVTNANGDYVVTVINTTTVDLQGSTFAGTYTASTGYARRIGAGARILASADDVIFSGCKAGDGASGLNRQEWGIYNQSPTTQFTGGNLTGNQQFGIDTSGSKEAMFLNNAGPENSAFELELFLSGAVVDGDYAVTGGPFWMAGKKFRVTRVQRICSAGSCNVKLRRYNGTATTDIAGLTNVGVTTTYNPGALASPVLVDGNLSSPFQAMIGVSGASGCSNLRVQVTCQMVGL